MRFPAKRFVQKFKKPGGSRKHESDAEWRRGEGGLSKGGVRGKNTGTKIIAFHFALRVRITIKRAFVFTFKIALTAEAAAAAACRYARDVGTF